jgi:copper(I)-binding protein
LNLILKTCQVSGSNRNTIMNLKKIASAAVIAAALTACAAPPAAAPAAQTGAASDITVTGAWARPALGGMAMDATKDPNAKEGSMNMGAMSAAYMVLENKGGEDALVGVSGDVAEMVQVHRTIEKDGMMSMEEAKEGMPVPANGKAELKPGGYHVMLINLKQDLKAGDTFKLTLKFKSGKELAVDVPVREP